MLKEKGTTEITIKPSERRQAMLDQKGICAKCKKNIKPIFSKFIRNPGTKKMEVICSNCAVPIPER